MERYLIRRTGTWQYSQKVVQPHILHPAKDHLQTIRHITDPDNPIPPPPQLGTPKLLGLATFSLAG